MSYPSKCSKTSHTPIFFEENIGQSNPQIKFILRQPDCTFLFLPTEILVGLISSDNTDSSRATEYFKISFENANPLASPVGQDPLVAQLHYLNTMHSSNAVTNISTFSKVYYNAIYPGIDLLFYYNEGFLEYDYIIHPGADPSQISLNFEGITALSLDETLDLQMATSSGAMTLRKPHAYQLIDEAKQSVEASFVIDHFHISLELGNYDSDLPLIIDPVLVYSTYLNGSSPNNQNTGIAVNTLGEVYVVGTAYGATFPMTTTIIGIPLNNSPYIFISKFDTNGQLLFSTLINGSSLDDTALATTPTHPLAIDLSDNIYLSGSTFSPAADFPATTIIGSPIANNSASFIAKISNNGTTLSYFVYLNGDNDDYATGTTIDSLGNAYTTGYSRSANWASIVPPAPYVHLGTPLNGSVYCLYTCKVDNTGTLQYFTTLAGESSTTSYDIAVDDSFNTYITGYTSATTFTGLIPTILPTSATLASYSKAFIVKFTVLGNALSYLTIIASPSNSSSIAVDTDYNAYIAGTASGANYPLVPSGNTIGTIVSTSNIFVSKLNSSGNGFIYSTLIGGGNNPSLSPSSQSTASALALDSSNHAYITGYTFAYTFPIANSLYPHKNTTADFNTNFNTIFPDAIICKLNVAGTALDFSTYIGGSFNDYGYAIAVDSTDTIYVAGSTDSGNFPTTNAFQDQLNTSQSTFVLKISNASINLSLTKIDAPDPVNVGDILTYEIEVTNNGPYLATNVIVTDTLPSSTVYLASQMTSGTVSRAGNILTYEIGSLPMGKTATISLHIIPTATGVITNTATVTSSATDSDPSDNTVSIDTTVVNFYDAFNDMNQNLTTLTQTVNNMEQSITSMNQSINGMEQSITSMIQTVSSIEQTTNNLALQNVSIQLKLDQILALLENLPTPSPTTLCTGPIIRGNCVCSTVICFYNKTAMPVNLLVFNKDLLECNTSSDPFNIVVGPNCSEILILDHPSLIYEIEVQNIVKGISISVAERTEPAYAPLEVSTFTSFRLLEC